VGSDVDIFSTFLLQKELLNKAFIPNKQLTVFTKIFLAFYLGFAREKVKIDSRILNISAGNIIQFHE